MARFIFLLLFLAQAFPGFASSSSNLIDPALDQPTLKSSELKKTVKLLEDPQERKKLLKTLKSLAVAQELEEKKQGRTLVGFLAPIVQFMMDNVSDFLDGLKKIPTAVKEGVDYLTVEKNRDTLWAALASLPLLLLLGWVFETVLNKIFRWRLSTSQRAWDPKEREEKERDYSLGAIYISSLLSLSFFFLMLHFIIPDQAVLTWVTNMWGSLFVIRIILLCLKMTKLSQQPVTDVLLEMPKKGWRFVKFWSEIAISVFLVSVVREWVVFGKYTGDSFIYFAVFAGVPFCILYLREWKAKEMQTYLEESKELITAPKVLRRVINFGIRYLPWGVLLIASLSGVRFIFSEESADRPLLAECIYSGLLLAFFLWGRRRIDDLSRYRLPNFPKTKAKAYESPLFLPFARALQWGLHISFFVTFLFIWNSCFSTTLVDIISHPFTNIGITIAMIWGITFLLWLVLDFFVQWHTTPQKVNGKTKEPTAFAKTFGPMLHSIARWGVILITTFMTLEAFGFDLKILVYLMSAFALAVSLGAQSLVKDIINGFFTLVDGRFAVGDIVTVGNYTGTVESLSLRAMTLRHSTGYLQAIPFSEVGNIINRSRDYTIVPIELATSYKTKIGVVYEALDKAAEDMKADPTFGKMILEPLSISGIDRFGENAVHVSASIKVTPDPKNYFVREFNRRLKIHMDALGITPPIAFQEEWKQG